MNETVFIHVRNMENSIFIDFFFHFFRFGRQIIFYISVLSIVLGRIATMFTTSYFTWFSIVSVVGSLCAISLFQSPFIIAMEISKPLVQPNLYSIQLVIKKKKKSTLRMIYYVKNIFRKWMIKFIIENCFQPGNNLSQCLILWTNSNWLDRVRTCLKAVNFIKRFYIFVYITEMIEPMLQSFKISHGQLDYAFCHSFFGQLEIGSHFLPSHHYQCYSFFLFQRTFCTFKILTRIQTGQFPFSQRNKQELTSYNEILFIFRLI